MYIFLCLKVTMFYGSKEFQKQKPRSLFPFLLGEGRRFQTTNVFLDCPTSNEYWNQKQGGVKISRPSKEMLFYFDYHVISLASLDTLEPTKIRSKGEDGVES